VANQVLEKTLVHRFDHVFVASETEAREVRRHTAFQHPSVLPNIRPLKWAPMPPPVAGPREILFVGVLSYSPNQDGVLWFCREVLPLLQQKPCDSVLFRIVGFGDTSGLDPIRDLRGVDLSGYQADLAPFYARAAMAVVPLRAGSGTRLKILEAFAYGRPVVSTTIGAEGLAVTHLQDILLADTAETFAQACRSLIDQPDLVSRITHSASRLCRELYSEEALLRAYDKVMRP
jgi:glycosyltransferase involved in cell wall biosynthesis